jgi:hypothetical protein
MSPAATPTRTRPPKPAEHQGGPKNEGEELCHLVEAHDPDTALCGKDVTGYPWNPPWPYCVVCLDLAENLSHWRDTIRALRGRS